RGNDSRAYPRVAAWSERRRARMRRKRPDDCQESGTGNRGQPTSSATSAGACWLELVGPKRVQLRCRVQSSRGVQAAVPLNPFGLSARAPPGHGAIRTSPPHPSDPHHPFTDVARPGCAARHGPERTAAAARDRLGRPSLLSGSLYEGLSVPGSHPVSGVPEGIRPVAQRASRRGMSPRAVCRGLCARVCRVIRVPRDGAMKPAFRE
ncbi:MAG: hypothetical protein K0S86_5847, partial [Geminicoccaceae bacterium]|nr:hypothetical protein [Geminicoccaceae bacterium]